LQSRFPQYLHWITASLCPQTSQILGYFTFLLPDPPRLIPQPPSCSLPFSSTPNSSKFSSRVEDVEDVVGSIPLPKLDLLLFSTVGRGIEVETSFTSSTFFNLISRQTLVVLPCIVVRKSVQAMYCGSCMEKVFLEIVGKLCCPQN